jgi:hypothetical protein
VPNRRTRNREFLVSEPRKPPQEKVKAGLVAAEAQSLCACVTAISGRARNVAARAPSLFLGVCLALAIARHGPSAVVSSVSVKKERVVKEGHG